MNVYFTGKTVEYDVTSSSVQSGFRRALSTLGCYFVHNSADEGERLEPLAAQLAEKLRPFHDGQDFNTGYIPSPNWKIDFWGEHYADLLKVKIRYDPDNLFTCYHCVGSDRTDFDDMFESTSATTTERMPNPLLLLVAALIYMF